MRKIICICLCLIVICSIIIVLGAERKTDANWIYVGSQTVYSIGEVEGQDMFFVTSVQNDIGDEFIFNNKKYRAFCQFSGEYEGYNAYLKSNGCAVCTLTTVLRAYSDECDDWSPYETITIAEKKVAGHSEHTNNYRSGNKDKMPISLFGINKVLEYYNITGDYVSKFSSDETVKADISNHLRKGNPVIFVVSRQNRNTGKYDTKWTKSYHTMLMVGIDTEDNVLIANPAGRQRFQMVSLNEMIAYMFSCKDEPNGFYWNGKSKCGGYIKIYQN